MIEEDQYPADSSRAGTSEGHSSFDELAKGLAKGNLTRGQALKLAGAAILGSVLVQRSENNPSVLGSLNGRIRVSS
jgi:hypothetical protein